MEEAARNGAPWNEAKVTALNALIAGGASVTVPVSGTGAFDGTVTVSGDANEGVDPAAVRYYICGLRFSGGSKLPRTDIDSVKYGPAPNTRFIPTVDGQIW